MRVTLYLSVLLFCIYASIRYIYRVKLGRNKYSSYIKLDASGVCIACLRCRKPPSDCWVEVDDYCISWLGKKPPI